MHISSSTWGWAGGDCRLFLPTLGLSPQPHCQHCSCGSPKTPICPCLWAFAHPINSHCPGDFSCPAHPVGLNFDVTSSEKLSLLMAPTPALDHRSAFSFFSVVTQYISVIIILADNGVLYLCRRSLKNLTRINSTVPPQQP